MDIYFVILTTLAILIPFGVFEGVVKTNKINKWALTIFLILSCVLNFIKPFNIMGISVSLNLILYLTMFMFLFINIKSIKGVIGCFLSALITIAVMLCYNVVDLSTFEYAFVPIYVFVGLIMGMALYYICPNYLSVFCGVFLGSVLFEFVFFEMSLQLSGEVLALGSSFCITFTFVTTLGFAFFKGIVSVFKYLKHNKKEKIETF